MVGRELMECLYILALFGQVGGDVLGGGRLAGPDHSLDQDQPCRHVTSLLISSRGR
jgi:hypothetical protein